MQRTSRCSPSPFTPNAPHRTVYPLLSLLDPARYGEILSGWLNAAREGGWFPRWSSPGYRSCMTGTHIDAVYADAAVKGIGGFDLAEAWRYLLKNAYEPVEPHGLF
ncbi:glycoside hydrolase domain-containing protein, partial [Brachyspira hyodysenteriae]|uniref:glycoside hydrolase domain-containing protein n=1 Tax=Brachyspira hyodysenteriae TaxID=159 RepID=UPI0034D1F21E